MLDGGQLFLRHIAAQKTEILRNRFPLARKKWDLTKKDPISNNIKRTLTPRTSKVLLGSPLSDTCINTYLTVLEPESETKVLAALCYGSSKGESVPRLFQFLAAPGIPGLLAASLPSLPCW